MEERGGNKSRERGGEEEGVCDVACWLVGRSNMLVVKIVRKEVAQEAQNAK